MPRHKRTKPAGTFLRGADLESSGNGGSPPSKSPIEICLNTRSACNDGIAISRKGVRYYDFENDKEGVYARDGVHAYCSEKAGATYQFENDAFRRIVDDD